MKNNNLINHTINQAYDNLTNIAKNKILIIGGYFRIIIPPKELITLNDYIDLIINQVFFKLVDKIKGKTTIKKINTITYNSYCFNNPSEALIKDCFNLVNEILFNKKSSCETTLFDLLNTLKEKHSKKELEKSLNTIFDILLTYYNTLE